MKNEIDLYYVGEGDLEVTAIIKEIKTGGANIYNNNNQLTKVSTIDEDEKCKADVEV
nr:4772_t:CDS:2 [Entrophospora candida]